MSFERAVRAGFETLRLSKGAGASLEVAPARGALVTSVKLAGHELLFLDEATFADPSQSLRGGIPLLFPIAGPAPSDSPMKQHGFARTLPWQVVRASNEGIELSLSSSASTRALFAFDFAVRFTLSVMPSSVKLAWRIENTGGAPMPWQLGLHPYFAVPLEQKAAARIETEATRAFDNHIKRFTPPLEPMPGFGGDEVDWHLLDHRRCGTVLHRGTEPAIALDWSPTFETLVAWTQPAKPFICVEPWSAPSLAARAGTALPLLSPGTPADLTLELSLA